MNIGSKPNREGEAPAEPVHDGSELPEGWAWARLEDVCSKIQDGTHHSPKNQSRSGKYKYVTAKNIKVWGIDLSDITYVDEATHREIYQRCDPKRGDVLYIKDGATTGIATVNPFEEEISLLSSVALLKPVETALDSTYLKWWLNSPTGYHSMTEQMSGSAITRLILRTIRASQIPIAPLAEQRRIVEKLEMLLGKVSSSQQRLSRIPGLLKRFRQSVLAAACSGKLTADWREDNSDTKRLELPNFLPTCESASIDADAFSELPDTWRLGLLDALLQERRGISYGIVKPGIHDPNGVRLLKSQQVRDGEMDLSADFRITRELDEEYARTRLQGGEILLNLVGASIGRSAIAPMELRGANVSRAIAVIPVIPEMTGWIQLNLRGPIGQKLIQDKTGGSAQPVLNLSEVRTLTIPLPPLAEQQEIVRRVEKLFAFADKIEARLKQAEAHVDRLTQSLLAKAFRGELVPTEHALATAEGRNYESASELLAHIQAIKPNAEPAKRKRGKTSKT